MAKKAHLWLFPMAVILGIAFDFLFWGRSLSVSFAIYMALLLAAGFWLAQRAGLKPARAAMGLLLPIALLSLVSGVRTEPLTVLLSRTAAVGLLALFAISFLGGQWPRFGFVDYVYKLLGFIPQGLGLMRANGAAPKSGALRWLLPVGRGLLLALPLLGFLMVLLASADAFFAEWVERFFADFERLPEFLWRGFIILVVAYILAAAYSYAFERSQKQALIGEDKPWVHPFIGFPEVTTVLVSVNLLLMVFVFVQFRYFFGGLANIVEGPAGFTFAEYARRGFAELVVVSLALLGSFMLLSALSKRENATQHTWFAGLGFVLFAQVAVILASAFQRLLLLEQAYGFSRLRTYPHVFMIWLGLLLLAVVLLEAWRRPRAFALAVLAASLGFVLSLLALNVDAFIVRANIAHAREALIGSVHQNDPVASRLGSDGPLDYGYLAQLSADAIPALVEGYRTAQADGDEALAKPLAAALACYFHLNPEMLQPDWREWNAAEATARREWAALQSEAGFPAVAYTEADYLPAVRLDDELWPCYPEWQR
ncbi:MAG: DUF4173 domain-containing protein [Anaerolineales bacterium]|nr:DUF4173 domain-containing protein [Anaerolineales bacterium]